MEEQRSDVQPAGIIDEGSAHAFRKVDLYSYSYVDRPTLLPGLTACISDCGGWLLERKTTSPAAMEFLFEVELVSIADLYGMLVGLGIELVRSTHTTLTELCTCSRYPRFAAGPMRIITLRLEVSFLSDVSLHCALTTPCSLA